MANPASLADLAASLALAAVSGDPRGDLGGMTASLASALDFLVASLTARAAADATPHVILATGGDASRGASTHLAQRTDRGCEGTHRIARAPSRRASKPFLTVFHRDAETEQSSDHDRPKRSTLEIPVGSLRWASQCDDEARGVVISLLRLVLALDTPHDVLNVVKSRESHLP